jgi:hypothetical protein
LSFCSAPKEEVLALDINIIHGNGYLEIAVTGSYDMKDAMNKFSHILDACRLSDSSKVLIDYIGLQGQGGATEKILYALRVEDLYQKYLKSGGHELQFACVVPLVVSYEPGVEIARNGGLPFKLFDNRNEAFEWLNVKRL